MGFLTTVTISVCVLSLVYSIMMLLTPDRFKRQMKSVISVIIAVTIGGIILHGGYDDSFLSALEIPPIAAQGSSNEIMIAELEARLNEQIEKLIEEKGIPVEKVESDIDIDADNCIFISRLFVRISGSKSEYQEKIRSIVKSDIGDVNLETAFTEESDGP